MKTDKLNSTQNFNSIRIAKNMPADIARAIKTNPTIRNAGKHFGLGFSFLQTGGKRSILCLMENPRRDSFYTLMLTPPHTINRKAYWFDFSELEKIKETPDFFEKMAGKEKKLSLWQRLVATYEAFKISMARDKYTAFELVDKYSAKYKPVFPDKL